MSTTSNRSIVTTYAARLLLCAAAIPATQAVADEPAVLMQQVIVIESVPLRVADQEAEPVPFRVADQKDEPAKPAEAVEDKKAEDNEKGSDAESAQKPAEKELSPDEIRKKMRELEQELQNARNQFQQRSNEQREKAKQEALKALDDVKLPKNPTRKQCETYVEELRKACEGRRSFSSNDPATKKLKELPVEHFDLLINEMSNRTSLRYYANYAMRDIDPENLRERFVKSIGENPNNIGIIVMHGWVEDIRPEIIEYINNADGNITPAWFQAAVELDEPSLYPKLHELTTQSRYASQFINMLEMLPDYDLAHTIDVCWRRSKDGKLSVSYSSFAAKAAEYGNAEALGSLVDQLRSSSSYMSHSTSYNPRRTNVLKYIDYRGSNSDVQAWYKANKDKLVFDHHRKRFFVPEDF